MRRLKTSTAIIALFALNTATTFAQDNQSFDLEIKPQRLTEALREFSDQTQMQLIYSQEQLKGIDTDGVFGHLDSVVALEKLLDKTRLVLHQVDDSTYAIRSISVSKNEFQKISFEAGENYQQNISASDDDENLDADIASQTDVVVVTGSRIKGAKITGALPVTVLGAADIAAVGAVSGDELFRSIPQMGDQSFHATRGQVSSNFARGDVGSIDLRNLGVGNTLVLINGRRTVTFPGSQASGGGRLAPVLSYNSNAIPVTGVERLEVLRDGASAIYGSDAVAGVVNTVLFSDYEGGKVDARYGFAEGTGLKEFNFNAVYGTDIDDGRGNISFFTNYTRRTALLSSDQDFTSNADQRPLFVGTDYEDDTQLDNRSTTTPWGVFQTLNGSRVSIPTVIVGDDESVTSGGGRFNITPSGVGDCRGDLGGGLCIDDSSTVDRSLRWNSPAAIAQSIMPQVDRINLFTSGHYEITEDVEMFGELGYYRAETHSIQNAQFTIGSIRMTIPSSNYWNPFGPVNFADGSVNPNRLAGIDAPAEGLDVILRTLRFADFGPLEVNVRTDQARALAGFRGEALGFDWETGFLYSEANVRDTQTGINATNLQRSLALSTPDAYNPFNGGDLNNRNTGDSTPSSQVALDAIADKFVRRGKSTLMSADFKISRPDLLTSWAGDIGMATGVEFRREYQLDDRDHNVDGSSLWFDTEREVYQPSNLFGTSPTPDNEGSRTIASAFIEFAVPLVSPDMEIPLVNAIDVQLAGRFEHYSDFGSIAKPKIAAAWDVFEGLRFRGSYSEGFRAPNLEQVNAEFVTRGNTREDSIRCIADLRSGAIAEYDDCSQNYVATSRRSGNKDLKAEESNNYSAGVVFEPRFIPESAGRLIFTADIWKIKQRGIVGIFGGQNALNEDAFQRLQGSTNPDVIRAAPSVDDVSEFAGSGIAPVGEVQFINDKYRNLEPQEVSGLDFGFLWTIDNDLGNWRLNVNAAKLLKYDRFPGEVVQSHIDARDAGALPAGILINEGGDQIRLNGNPEWRGTASLTWSNGPLTLTALARYTDGFDDTSLTVNGDLTAAPFPVNSHTTFNFSGNYMFEEGSLEGTRIGVGIRNVFDKKPPLADAGTGYVGSVHSPLPRYWYMNLSKEF